jgi:hypothetical protein
VILVVRLTTGAALHGTQFFGSVHPAYRRECAIKNGTLPLTDLLFALSLTFISNSENSEFWSGAACEIEPSTLLDTL